MAILVTGGAGYIGSETVATLIKDGYETIVVDNLSTGHVKAIDPAAEFYEGDVRDREFLDYVFAHESIDAVIHFASDSIVADSMKDPLKYFDNNDGGTISLLEAMRDHGVKKLVFSSTAAVYGQPDEMPIKEDAPKHPTNAYGQSKWIMEQMAHWADVAYGIKFTALRYFNVGGASRDGVLGEDHNPETHLIPIILQVANGQRDVFKMFGDDYQTPDGTNIRDYVHVVDLANAHVLAMKRLLNGGDSTAFNIGSSHGFSNSQILQAARKVTGDPIETEKAPRRPGDPDELVADSTRARTELGWHPQFDDIESIISDAWRFKQAHPHGYEKRKQ
ncbi:UDP-glucose 4-epimerase GalE [Lactobacillus sp. Sy-1]|uniref:UDP-glucose 4-epimerase GalE n=1 Tax=Lactobacillus sp. Sy-1 TaxID=2109645 RepID=UPI001C59AA6B|nr:UDP-glucose 4-epimerase GalE [Lactobacillus sp. Sy-1]MBW1605179.1 UDP-glucose 4-epimerase GalE [Lactobacillus sp. Sy-1]